MFSRRNARSTGLISSKLCNQDNFYEALSNDLRRCRSELIIESPFITVRRVNSFLDTLSRLKRRGVHIVVNTKDPLEIEEPYRQQAQQAINQLQNIYVNVLFTGGHHRKLAIIDKSVIWEGSLNILSHNDSCEIMRRIESTRLAHELIDFIKLKKFVR